MCKGSAAAGCNGSQVLFPVHPRCPSVLRLQGGECFRATQTEWGCAASDEQLPGLLDCGQLAAGTRPSQLGRGKVSRLAGTKMSSYASCPPLVYIADLASLACTAHARVIWNPDMTPSGCCLHQSPAGSEGDTLG